MSNCAKGVDVLVGPGVTVHVEVSAAVKVGVIVLVTVLVSVGSALGVVDSSEGRSTALGEGIVGAVQAASMIVRRTVRKR